MLNYYMKPIKDMIGMHNPINEITMLRWKCREVMARYNISNRELAIRLGKHETSIPRLKKDRMPSMSGDELNALCRALGCTPMDLIEYIPDKTA